MSSDRKTILIADDEEDLTWSVSRYLRKNDCTFDVECVGTADEALLRVEEKSFDLIISDVRMPGISGLELYRVVQQRWPSTGFIVMTAYGSEQVEQLTFGGSSLRYIEKPFELAVFRDVVYQTLNKPRPRRRLPVADTGIRDIIKLHCQTRNTSRLTLEKGIQKGNIYFQNGEIVHAECGELEGEIALGSILDWKQAESYLRNKEFSSKRTINRRWQNLLNASLAE